MKKIVITGATGMTGIALLEECIKNSIEVLAIIRKNSVRRNRIPSSDLIHIYECELDKLEDMQEISGKYDVFYHFAWNYTSKAYRDDPELQEKNIRYTLDAVKLAHRLGCHKFIGAGSQAEYGPVHHRIAPDTPIAPSTAYGMAKYAAGKLSETLCRRYGMFHIWGRIFSVYGRYDNEDTMLQYAIRQFSRQKPAQFSSGTQMWDYLHENDAGKIFFLMGERVEKNVVYCVASGNARPLKEYISFLQSCFDSETACKFDEKSDTAKTYGIQADISALVEDIGYTPRIPFEQGVQDMVMYIIHKNNIKRTYSQNEHTCFDNFISRT